MSLHRDSDVGVMRKLDLLFDSKSLDTEEEVRALHEQAQKIVEEYRYDPKPIFLFENVPAVDEDEYVSLDSFFVPYREIPFSFELGRVGHVYSLRVDPTRSRLEEIQDILYPSPMDSNETDPDTETNTPTEIKE